jgi:hypothetical protein
MGEVRHSACCETTCTDADAITLEVTRPKSTDTVAVKFTKGGDGGNVPQFDTPLPDEQATTTESVFAVPKHGSPNVDVFGKI